jgi:hypothetical protein
VPLGRTGRSGLGLTATLGLDSIHTWDSNRGRCTAYSLSAAPQQLADDGGREAAIVVATETRSEAGHPYTHMHELLERRSQIRN